MLFGQASWTWGRAGQYTRVKWVFLKSTLLPKKVSSHTTVCGAVPQAMTEHPRVVSPKIPEDLGRTQGPEHTRPALTSELQPIPLHTEFWEGVLLTCLGQPSSLYPSRRWDHRWVCTTALALSLL